MTKKCYWGCIGVLWKRPLPVWEIMPNNTEPETEPLPPLVVHEIEEHKCYRFRAYEHVHDYIKVMEQSRVYNSPTDGRHTIWKAHRPLNPGAADSMSFETADFNG